MWIKLIGLLFPLDRRTFWSFRNGYWRSCPVQLNYRIYTDRWDFSYVFVGHVGWNMWRNMFYLKWSIIIFTVKIRILFNYKKILWLLYESIYIRIRISYSCWTCRNVEKFYRDIDFEVGFKFKWNDVAWFTSRFLCSLAKVGPAWLYNWKFDNGMCEHCADNTSANNSRTWLLDSDTNRMSTFYL